MASVLLLVELYVGSTGSKLNPWFGLLFRLYFEFH